MSWVLKKHPKHIIKLIGKKKFTILKIMCLAELMASFHMLVILLFSKNSKFKNYCALSICVLLSSADNLCNRFGPRSGPTKVDFEKIRRRQKSMQNYPFRKELKYIFKNHCFKKNMYGKCSKISNSDYLPKKV